MSGFQAAGVSGRRCRLFLLPGIAELPGVFRQWRRLIRKRAERRIPCCALAPELLEVMCLPEGHIVPGQKCFCRLLGSLLGMKQDIPQQAGIRGGKLMRRRAQIQLRLAEPGAHVLEPRLVSLHGALSLRAVPCPGGRPSRCGAARSKNGCRPAHQRRLRCPAELRRPVGSSSAVGGIVGYDHQQVIVAIWSGITPRNRTEQVDPLRLISLDETPDNLRQNRIALREVAAHPVVRARHELR